MLECLLRAGLGCFSWTFVKHAFHGWVVHRSQLRTLSKREHLAHHAHSGYFTALGLKLKMIFTGHAMVLTLAIICVDLPLALVFTLSFGLLYLLCECVHYSNLLDSPAILYGVWARKHHFLHHFEDAQSIYGVTTPCLGSGLERTGNLKKLVYLNVSKCVGC